jgi:integrase/recombinase XerD
VQGLLKQKPGRWVFGVEEHVVKNIGKSIDNAARKAGIKKKITPNMLGHTFATILLMKGADLKSIQALMEHSDIATTQKYLHAVESQLRKSVDLLED